MKNKSGYIIYLEDEIHFLKNIEMKIYNNYINFQSNFSDRTFSFKKSDILSIQIYYKSDKNLEVRL